MALSLIFRDKSIQHQGSGDTVLVFSLVHGIDQIGWVRTSISDPRAGLEQVGVPDQDIDKLLAP